MQLYGRVIWYNRITHPCSSDSLSMQGVLFTTAREPSFYRMCSLTMQGVLFTTARQLGAVHRVGQAPHHKRGVFF